ncbi:TVP38/TMEM64 family protein [Methylobacterium sp. C25]|uniref:TVP38/TMEM64 family protein n=1 Tax=Methylobacterium sp. C25 TaxID=2721622 RepID=UPI001F3801C8|nr:VTT domain-containing protein [Methylobacterium sp. C25]MCE4223605.1 TVP38/TMEM64 family protein [Methylobacterium sp. C25]
MTSADEPRPERPSKAWLRWLPLVLLVCISLAVLIGGGAHLLDVDQLMASRAWLHAAVAENRPRAIAVAAAVYVACVVVSVPASLVLSMICGFLFGTVTGALTAIGSATTGAAIVFSIGRYAARDILLRRAGSRLGRLAEGFRRDAFGYVAFLRLLPLFPFWMTNLGPAIFGVRPRTFVLATLLGLTPGAFVYAATGAGLEEIVAAHEAAKTVCLARGDGSCDAALDLRSLVTPGMIAGLVALALFALLSVGLRRWLARRGMRS